MAFLGRVGNILRQTASRKIGSELRSSPSIFHAVRCMSNAPSTKLFIGGVSYSTDEQSLREVFTKYGEVVDARIITDRETGRSRGFAFVTYSTVEEASSAIQALDGQDLHGRLVKVNFANERPHGFGGGGFGGSYDTRSAGGNYSGSGMNYGNDGGFASGNTYGGRASGVYGGNSGSYGGAASGGGNDIGNYGSSTNGGGYGSYGSGFSSSDNYGSSAGFGGSDNYAAGAAGGGSSSGEQF